MLQNRSNIVRAAFALVALVFVVRLFYLQIIDETYKTSADMNALKKVPDYAYRGLIYDRKGRLIVNNQVVFDVNVIPREMPKDGMDTVGFCQLVGIDIQDFRDKIEEVRAFSRIKSSTFVSGLSQEEASRVMEHLNEFPGFSVASRTIRAYERPCMSHAIGYMSEISKEKFENKEKYGYYLMGEHLGVSGIEQYYEEVLRGKRGTKFVMMDVHGVNKGAFRNGQFDTAAVKGLDLHSSVDIALQEYAEKLFVNKAGAAIAIEPQTGEILAMVSAPTYNPYLLTGRNLGKNFKKLSRDSTKPLLNRAVQAPYPPGSIFKTMQALIALQLGVIDTNTVFPCNKSLVNCHGHPNPCNLRQAIQWSCNPYFVQVYRKIINQGKASNTFIDTHLGYEQWYDFAKKFNMGNKFLIDFPGTRSGVLYRPTTFDKIYGQNRWKYSNIYSLSIGQGEIGLTPLHMANLACVLANKGWYKTPHFAKAWGDAKKPVAGFDTVKKVPIDPRHFDVLHEGMKWAVQYGTVWSSARMKSVEICGKTGTAQNPAGKDHSVFICFAPKQNPKIAIACVVENAGWGGFAAAPIASLMIEKYLNDTIQRKNLETMMLEKDYMSAYRAGTAR